MWTWNCFCFDSQGVISGSQMGSQFLQNTEIIKQTDVLLWKIWGIYGSVLYLFSCTYSWVSNKLRTYTYLFLAGFSMLTQWLITPVNLCSLKLSFILFPEIFNFWPKCFASYIKDLMTNLDIFWVKSSTLIQHNWRKYYIDMYRDLFSTT